MSRYDSYQASFRLAEFKKPQYLKWITIYGIVSAVLSAVVFHYRLMGEHSMYPSFIFAFIYMIHRWYIETKYGKIKEIGMLTISDDDIRIERQGVEELFKEVLELKFNFKGLKDNERKNSPIFNNHEESNGADNELIIVTAKSELKKYMVILEDETEYKKFQTILARFERRNGMS